MLRRRIQFCDFNVKRFLCFIVAVSQVWLLLKSFIVFDAGKTLPRKNGSLHQFNVSRNRLGQNVSEWFSTQLLVTTTPLGPVLATAHYDTTMGIGNALFIYASLLGHAFKHGLVPVIDVNASGFPLFDIFNLHAPVTAISYFSWQKVSEKCCCCYDEPLLLNDNRPHLNYKFVGYWQSYKYFESIKQLLLNSELIFHDSLRQKSHQILDNLRRQHCEHNISRCLMVGVHVRRGDFNSMISQYRGYMVANITYLLKGMKHYVEKYARRTVVFVVLGNDLSWNQENLSYLPGLRTEIISPVNPGHDLCLLASCDHILMTTGTYGWWTGYLAQGDVVYAKDNVKPGSFLDTETRFEDVYYPQWLGL